MKVPIVLGLVAAVVVSACSSSGSSLSPAAAAPSAASTGAASAAPSTAPSGGAATSLTVLAASSLTAAFKDIATAYQTKNPGLKITLAFDASSALRTQIEQGAPADVFASADTTNAQKLVDENLTNGAAVNFAGNLLTVIAPAAGSNLVQSPMDLAKTGVKYIAAGDAVPITKYASQLLANLARQPGYPSDFVAKVTANTASKEDNVKAVVAKIELAEGDGAIVYVTDAKASTKVKPVDVPKEANVPATYAAVVTKASKSADASKAFLDFVTSADGQAILARYGFLPPP